MRFAVLGPVAPFRSGIARHTTALARAMAATPGCEVRTWSFARQYPERLYPGDGQYHDNRTPPADLAPTYRLDSVSPPSWFATSRAILAERPDVAIIPAWTFFVAPALGTVARRLRASGVPVIALVHNASDHEPARWKRAASAYQLRAADHAIAHTGSVAESIRELAPGLPVTVFPHPLYDDYPADHAPLPRRAATELLFFGVVRPYKGIPLLLDALERVRSDTFLTIAGEVWGDAAALRAEIARRGLAQRVELRAGYVPDSEVAALFGRCDAVVAPYTSASGSGVVALALHYGKPVLATDVAALREAIGDGRTGWLVAAGDPAALAEAIDTRVSAAAAARMSPHIANLRQERSWPHLARRILEVSKGLSTTSS